MPRYLSVMPRGFRRQTRRSEPFPGNPGYETLDPTSEGGGGMATALDVAAYILAKSGAMSAMKLQKLVYYAKAWHLVWDEQSLYSEPIEAWANGPVVRALYNCHRGRFTVSPGDIAGNPDGLTHAEKESVDVVLDFYGDWSAHQ